MGEAKRRRGERETPESPSGPYLYAMTFLRPERVPALVAAARAGDRQAARLLVCASNFIQEFTQAAGTDEPMQCLLCDFEFIERPPACLVFIIEHDEDPQNALCNALCEVCERGSDLLPRILAAYRQYGMVDDARILPMASELGHA